MESRSKPSAAARFLHFWTPGLACLFFLLAGLAYLPRTGIENDEALFAGTFLKPYGGAYTVRIGHSRVPLMVMAYIGTLKAWLYRPIMSIFGTNLLVLRLPVLLAGVAGVWLFYRLLYRIAGLRAAIIGCTLLAVDATYLLTIVFDWGPVALQHLLLLAGLVLLVEFDRKGSLRALFWGCCMLGLGVWDKALGFWMLGGIGVAGLAIFPTRLWALATRRRLAVAALGFALGALPLLVFNLENHWATFAGNVRRDTSDLPGKARMLMDTAEGKGLFGWMFDEQYQTPAPHAPSGLLERASADISSLAHHPRRHLLFYAFLLALLLAPLARWGALRGILFGLVAMAVAWLQMATNSGTGGSVHHTILLWPFPQLVVAISLAAASQRLGRAGIPALAVVTTVLAVSGALVANEYFYVSYTYGGAPVWSESIYTLSDYLKGLNPPGTVYCVDWGMFDSLRYLNHGKLKLADATEFFTPPQLPPGDFDPALRVVADPGAIYIAHTKDFENFPGTSNHLIQFAAGQGYRQEVLSSISDTFGRPAFEVYRFDAP